MNRRFHLIAFVVTISAFSVLVLGQQHAASPVAPDDEYAVYAAVLDAFQKLGKARHPLVADKTSTFSCEGGGNGFAIGGCNGLRGGDESPTERMAIVKKDLPKLQVSTVSEFKSLNGTCSEIRDSIPSSSKYYLFGPTNGPKLPKDWEHADFVYLSRVAFNPAHTQALVNVGFMSGTNAEDSEGAYYLLRNNGGKWIIDGSSAVWQLTPPQ